TKYITNQITIQTYVQITHRHSRSNRSTPPTYPFPAYSIVKEQNDGTKDPVAEEKQINRSPNQKQVSKLPGGVSIYANN
ncbi:MAG TPA: hypothetical protein PLO16_11110, partial [Acidocella sp.]|nr:hypothetical protein [Acidocella sp.]